MLRLMLCNIYCCSKSHMNATVSNFRLKQQRIAFLTGYILHFDRISKLVQFIEDLKCSNNKERGISRQSIHSSTTRAQGKWQPTSTDLTSK